MMLVTGAIGAITGGNSLINVPLMIAVGMSPRQAVATNMFAVTFMTISATARFARARVLKWPLLVPLGAITLLTSALGALIAVKLPESIVKIVVGISMAILVVFIALQRKAEPPPPSAARLLRRDAAGRLRRLLLGRLHDAHDGPVHGVL
jgi:hypothetical protein